MPFSGLFSPFQDESLSVKAAFKKRLLAVRPENSKWSGFPRGEASEMSDSYLTGAMLYVLFYVAGNQA
jgi:hypothetical protein